MAARSSRCATPPSPSAGARSTPCTEPLEQRAAHDVFDIPTPPQETTCAVTRGAHVGARARSAPAFGAERVARGSDPAATGARARSAHAIGAELVTRGGAGSQCAACALWLPHCPTRTRARDVLHPESKQQTTPAAPRDALECVAALARTREDRQNCVRFAYL